MKPYKHLSLSLNLSAVASAGLFIIAGLDPGFTLRQASQLAVVVIVTIAVHAALIWFSDNKKDE